MSNFAEFDVPDSKNPSVPPAPQPTSKPEQKQREDKQQPSRATAPARPYKAGSFNPRFIFTIVGLAGLYVFAVGVFAKFQPETQLFFASELHPYMYFGWLAALIALSISKSGMSLWSIISRVAWFAFIIGSVLWAGSLVWGWIQTGVWWTFGL